MKIGIVGTGYVGLISGVGFAKLGHEVVCIDVMPSKVDGINNKIPPIFEEGLQEALDELVPGKLQAFLDFSKLASCEIIFICVGTPSNGDGAIDLTFVKSAAQKIGEVLKNADDFKVIVVKSTVSPTTTERIVTPILEKSSGRVAGKDFGVAMNPEFLREGVAIQDFMAPDRIVIGAVDAKSKEILSKSYASFSSPIVFTNMTTAELIKYASNAFLATKVSLANELGNVAKKLGVDFYDVAKGIGLDKRINPHFLNAGIGYGGSCFPKDVSELRQFARSVGVETKILDAVSEVNGLQPLKLVSLLKERLGGLDGKKIGVLGLAFKANTDDVRESRAVPIILKLLEERASVFAFDPKAVENMRKVISGSNNLVYCSSAQAVLENCDIILITTDWAEFAGLDYSSKRVFEGKRALNNLKLRNCEGICW